MDPIAHSLTQPYTHTCLLLLLIHDWTAKNDVGEFDVTPEGFAHITDMLMQVAPDGKLVMCMEGGYFLDSLCNCVSAVVKTLRGNSPMPLARGDGRDEREGDVEPHYACLARLRTIAKEHSQHWPVLAKACEPEYSFACPSHRYAPALASRVRRKAIHKSLK